MFLAFGGRYLVVNQTPVKSDVIIVLGGGSRDRVQRAVELFRRGYAPEFIMSGGAMYNARQSQAEHMRQQAMDMGVSQRDVILENRSNSTYGNAVYSRSLVVHRRFTSAIVVSSDFHMRRVQFIFDKVFSKTGVRLTFCAAPSRQFDPGFWWRTPRSAEITLIEYSKLAVYWIAYGLL
ncbi:MAG: YdcF family protein [Bacilli bacterium]